MTKTNEFLKELVIELAKTFVKKVISRRLRGIGKKHKQRIRKNKCKE